MGKPKDPPPLGRGPKAGYDSPRFPTVGQKDVKAPPGGYKSVISTKAPIDKGAVKRITAVNKAFKNVRGKKGTAGDKTRDAFAGATRDTSKNAMDRAIDKFLADYMRQAEKSRSEDILSQRQNQLDRYRMDVFKDIFDTDTSTRYTEGTKDLNQYYDTEKKNEQAKRTAMILSFLGSMI
jgi:hypothetical protein